jgi:hypothetical protein
MENKKTKIAKTIKGGGPLGIELLFSDTKKEATKETATGKIKEWWKKSEKGDWVSFLRVVSSFPALETEKSFEISINLKMVKEKSSCGCPPYFLVRVYDNLENKTSSIFFDAKTKEAYYFVVL